MRVRLVQCNTCAIKHEVTLNVHVITEKQIDVTCGPTEGNRNNNAGFVQATCNKSFQTNFMDQVRPQRMVYYLMLECIWGILCTSIIFQWLRKGIHYQLHMKTNTLNRHVSCCCLYMDCGEHTHHTTTRMKNLHWSMNQKLPADKAYGLTTCLGPPRILTSI